MIHENASFVISTEKVGLGGLYGIAQANGCWGWGQKIYGNHSLVDEFLTILKAMHSVEAHKLPNSIIHSDCKFAMDMITEDTSDVCMNIVKYSCRKWIKWFPEIHIKHCHRNNFNLVVDSLAKACRAMDVGCNVTRIFSFPSSYCNELLVSDCNILNNIN